MKISLRPVTLEDGNYIVQWRNNPNVMSHCKTKAKVTLESNANFYKDYILTGKYKQFMVERIDEDFGVFSYVIATVYLKDIDYDNGTSELCIFTSNDEEWTSESQSLAIRMLVEKAFGEYKMRKLYSYVFSQYENEKQLLENAGFKQEAILKDEVVNADGSREDLIRMCIYNEN